LRYMYINCCGFSGPIPDAIGNLTNLKSMQIQGHNSLSPIPCPIGHQNFGSLIPYAIGQLSELELLVLQAGTEAARGAEGAPAPLLPA
jgi:hypothetical protein